MSAASGDRVTTRPARNNASENNNAQAGPVRLIWFDIYPPSQPLEPGIEVSAPLLSLPPLPPLSRPSSRTSSSTSHSFPATPCLPGSMLPNVTMAIPQDAGQDNLQVPDGDWSTSPLYMLGPDMVFPPEIAAGIAMPSAPEYQPSQMYNSAGVLCAPPQLHSSQGCSSAGSSCAPTQTSLNPPQNHATVTSNKDLQFPATTNLPESYQFTFTAQPQLKMPNQSCLDPMDVHHFHPSLYELSSDSPWDADSHHLVSTLINYGQNENLDVTAQQEQDIGPATGLEIDSMFPDFTPQAHGNGISTNDDTSWVDDIMNELASMPPPPDSASQLQQTAGLSAAGQSTVPASVLRAQLKRTRDESEGGAIGEATEAPEPTNQKRSKTTGGSRHAPLTKRRHAVRGADRKTGDPCGQCRSTVTAGREWHHRRTRTHVEAVHPIARQIPGAWQCPICGAFFSRKDSCRRHKITTHGENVPGDVIYHRELEELMMEIVEAVQLNGNLSPELMTKIHNVIQLYGTSNSTSL